MDSLRYWVTEMHVDGFRFDLAATLARELHDVDQLSAFFDLIQQDPVVSQVKLIAEPWDVGEGGYQVGNFPPLWSEWNGKYRDEVRDFWRGAEHTVAEFGYRFTGSSDLYEDTGRTPVGRINFVTAHDGFTLTRPRLLRRTSTTRPTARTTATAPTTTARGTAASRARPTTPAINALRRRQRRNLLATLLLSQGVPDAPRRRRARPHPGRQQQRLLPGQRGLLVRLGGRRHGPAGVHPPADRAPARRTRCSAGAASSRASRSWARTSTTSAGSRPRGVPMSDGRLADRLEPLDRCVPERRGPPRARAPRRAPLRRQLLRGLQRLRRATRTSRLPDESYGRAWAVVLDTGPDDVQLAFPRKRDPDLHRRLRPGGAGPQHRRAPPARGPRVGRSRPWGPTCGRPIGSS